MWQPENGHQYLRSLPEQGPKPSIAVVKTAESRELKSLESFIQMKERCISKRMYVQKNLDAIEEAWWLTNYLIHFPTANKSEATRRFFWPKGNIVPNEQVNNDRITTEYIESSTNGASSSSIEATNLLRNLPPLECIEYFDPRRQKPCDNSSKPTKKQRAIPIELCRIEEAANENPFSKFDPFTYVQVGYFVAMSTSIEDRGADIPFFLGKVIKLRGHSIKTKTMMVIWYWLKPTFMQDEPSMWIQRYQNCMHRKWEPSYEPADWMDVDVAITSWENQSKKSETCIVDGIRTEREISIPKAQTYHLIQHMAQQMDAVDDEKLENDVHNVQHCNSD